MTYQTCILDVMPTARCERVPPTGATKWGAIDLTSLQEDDLPLDPRTWNRSEVASWVSRRGGLPERFPMNGKALCLMNRDMFVARVPHGGHHLHQEFTRRLAKALAFQDLIDKLSKTK
ncbi:ets DNA-binding protein pokkuri [Hyposmocoma kahamanoa]|uniref:ets DNA-binding protein pokkuri n=1 Tax=Hyposmocoma kahamanoa TaxID=1477025 RepID=UPI000E6DA05B|nr:ets DNA-binding protein pokkuri [Hyposmocoma kahamanoa]